MFEKYSVLFVCTGNICRSPTAEGVMRARLQAAGLAERVVVDSAGTHDYHGGEPPDERSIAAARRRGIDISGLRARQLRAEDFAAFDLMLAMDQGHLAFMERMAARLENKGEILRARRALFLSYAPQAGILDVPDPYYSGTAAFDHALDLAEQGVDTLLEFMRRELI